MALRREDHFDFLDAVNATIQTLVTQTFTVNIADITDIVVETANIADLTASIANIADLTTSTANIADLTASTANITDLTADTVDADTVTCIDVDATGNVYATRVGPVDGVSNLTSSWIAPSLSSAYTLTMPTGDGGTTPNLTMVNDGAGNLMWSNLVGGERWCGVAIPSSAFRAGVIGAPLYRPVVKRASAVMAAYGSPSVSAYLSATEDLTKLEGITTFSVDCWLKITSLPPVGSTSAMFTVYEQQGTGVGFGIYLARSGGSINGANQVFIGTNKQALPGISSKATLSSSRFIHLNAWHYFTCIHDGVNVRVYIDGIFSGLVAKAVPTAGSLTAVSVGISTIASPPTGVFGGYIQNMTVLGRPLSCGEIANRYNLGQGWVGGYSYAQDQTISYWMLDELAGGVVVDQIIDAIDPDAPSPSVPLVPTGSVTFGTGSLSTCNIATNGLYGLVFPSGVDAEASFTIELPHRWKVGTRIYPHIHTVTTEPAVPTGRNIRWGLEYSLTSTNGLFSVSSLHTEETNTPMLKRMLNLTQTDAFTGHHWNLGDGWSNLTSNGWHCFEHAVGATGNLTFDSEYTQDPKIRPGGMYRMSFGIADRTEGSVSIDIGGNVEGTAYTTNVQNVTSDLLVSEDPAHLQMRFIPTADFNGKIGGILLYQSAECPGIAREIDRTFDTGHRWTLGSGWSNGSSSLVATHASSNVTFAAGDMLGNLFVENTRTYTVTLTTSDVTSGTLTPYLGNVNNGSFSANTTSNVALLVNDDNLDLSLVADDFTGNIADISLVMTGLGEPGQNRVVRLPTMGMDTSNISESALLLGRVFRHGTDVLDTDGETAILGVELHVLANQLGVTEEYPM